VSDSDLVLDIQGLRTHFHTDAGVVKAVDGVSFHIPAATTLGVVGESGSGKSVTSLTVMGLLPEHSARIAGGSISFLGRDLLKLTSAQMSDLRGREIAMIFQEPMTSLNPVFRVGDQVAEAIIRHQKVKRKEAMARTIELFHEVGIPDPVKRVDSYPHEMSGGQKQRVMIAMALSCNPKLLIADEPTTALDVTIQARILDLLRKLRDERQMSIMFITHDLGVIAEIADQVAVMYRGKLVESGSVKQIFANPQHAYTKGLLNCRPRLDTKFLVLPTVEDYLHPSEEEAGDREMTGRDLSESLLDRMRRGVRLRPQRVVEQWPADRSGGAELVEDRVARDKIVGTPEGEPLLSVKDLKVHFPLKKNFFGKVLDVVYAVDGISFDVYPGQTLGLVGESGCGKTTTGRAILRLVEPTSGEVWFKGRELTGLDYKRMTEIRKDLQIIFQDPYSSLNPRLTVEQAITEPMLVHGIGANDEERRARAASLLIEVGLKAEHLNRFPHEFSGGQRQRICIARTLALEPQLIICDESVSALDVSVQAQVLNLLKELQVKRGLTYIFISHDLSVVKFMSDVMCVMQPVVVNEGGVESKRGRIVEAGPADAIYANPSQAYTRELISAIPRDDLDHIDRRQRDRIAAADRRHARNGA
jgi:peptide/nickel transport system ATP-binding protein